jgi:hypothetical protein
MSNPPIKIEKLDRPAPPKITAILDGLNLLTRNILIARLNNLTNGKSLTPATLIGGMRGIRRSSHVHRDH